MRVFFLGRGSALNLRENNTNILLTQSEHVLLDCGITCPYSLFKHGLHPKEISYIAISHLHSDHVGGLETFAWHHFVNHSKLKVFSKVNVRDYLYPAMGHYVDEVIEFHNEDFSINDIKVQFIKTEHVDNLDSYGYIVNDRILFTMDTNKVMTGDYDVIFHDCCHIRTSTHACLEDLRALPSDVKKKIWLMHLNDVDYGDVSDFGGMVIESTGKI